MLDNIEQVCHYCGYPIPCTKHNDTVYSRDIRCIPDSLRPDGQDLCWERGESAQAVVPALPESTAWQAWQAASTSSVAKFGEENFAFEVLEYTSKDMLLNVEQNWIDRTQCTNRKIGFNVYAVAGSPGDMHARVWRGRITWQLNMAHQITQIV